METLQTLQAEAIRALRDVLRDPDAKPDTRLRAAEALLRAEPSAAPVGKAALEAATDEELLAAARGVHPREKGPAVPAAETVPSDTLTLLAQPVSRHGGDPKGTRDLETAGGTQNGPAKCDPPGLALPKRGKLKPALDRQISLDNTPRDSGPTPTPEPWE